MVLSLAVVGAAVCDAGRKGFLPHLAVPGQGAAVRPPGSWASLCRCPTSLPPGAMALRLYRKAGAEKMAAAEIHSHVPFTAISST